jgi:hypothetical protein
MESGLFFPSGVHLRSELVQAVQICAADGLFGNLNNQRISFFAAVISCKHLQATLVMPHWHIQEGVLVPFSRLWDAEHLLQQATANGVGILLPAAADASTRMCPAATDRASLPERLAQFSSGAAGTLCATPQEAFFQLWQHGLTEEETQNQGFLLMHKVVAHSTQFAEARAWLRPAKAFVDRAQRIVSSLVMEAGSFIALHLRTEGVGGMHVKPC